MTEDAKTALSNRMCVDESLTNANRRVERQLPEAAHGLDADLAVAGFGDGGVFEDDVAAAWGFGRAFHGLDPFDDLCVIL